LVHVILFESKQGNNPNSFHLVRLNKFVNIVSVQTLSIL